MTKKGLTGVRRLATANSPIESFVFRLSIAIYITQNEHVTLRNTIMALQVNTEKQGRHIKSLDFVGYVLDDGKGVRFNDDVVTFDEMAEIVDYLRTSDTMTELFEECWIAYKRKGSKKKSLDYWKKLTETEKQNVLPHVKAYVSTRDLQYQKDFERYLRDKTFQTVVFSGNNIVYDPTKLGKGESTSSVYMPSGNFSITWDDTLKAYLYIGYYSDYAVIPDGYTDDNRPDGATIVLNNGRGTIVWSSKARQWKRTK